MGTLCGPTVKIHIQQDARQRLFHSRPVAHTLGDEVKAELDQLCKANVTEPVQFSDWAAPVVPVLKSDGSLQFGGHYNQTVNTVAIPDYPNWMIYWLLWLDVRLSLKSILRMVTKS